MTPRHRLSLVAGGATLLATAPLATVFDQWTWAIDVILAVGAVVGAAMLARQLRAPVWAQVLAMLAALTVMVTWLFGAGTAFLGTVPSGRTLRHWADLATSAGSDIRDLAVPVPDRQSLLFLACAGVGLVAIVIDVCAVGLRRPALAGMAMLPLYSIPVMVRSDSVMFLSFIVAASGYLWLLATDNVDRVRRFGRRFTGDGRDVDAWEPSPLAAAGRRLAVAGVLAAVLLPVAIPGMTGGLLDRFGTGAGGGDGAGSGSGGAAVSLFATLSGQLNLKQTFVMVKVTNSDPNPYYLRFGVADQVTAQGFRNHTARGGIPAGGDLPDPTISRPGVSQTTYHASIEIVNLNMGLLPFYTDLLHTQKVDGKWAYDQNGQIVYSNRTTSKNKKYSFDYVHTTFTEAALRQADPLLATDPYVQQYTAVPPIESIATLVNELTAGADTQYDRVRALYNYFSASNNFVYSLTSMDTKDITGSDIVKFLQRKSGFCVQYAAALAWLVRQAGIPARVAFGYTRGGSRDGASYSLTNVNLHAWTEVYFSGLGWVPFDATPASHIGGSAPTVWAPDVNRPSNDPSTGPSAASPGAGSSGGLGASGSTKDPDGNQPNPFGSGGAPVAQNRTWPYWVLGTVVFLLLLLLLPAVRRSSIRRRRLPGKTGAGGPRPTVAPAGTMQVIGVADPDGDAARAAAHYAWDELVDTLVDFKVPVDPAETPRVTAARVIHRLRLTGPVEESATLVAHAEERARYARVPLAEPDLTGPVRSIRKALKQHVSRRTRLGAALFPRSVLARWRIALSNATIAANTAVGRAGESLSNVAHPRRLFPGRPR